MLVSTSDNNLVATIPPDHWYHALFDAAPKRRKLQGGRWTFPPILAVMDWVRANLPELAWDPVAEAQYNTIAEGAAARERVAKGEIDLSDPLSNIPFKLPPYDHQRKALLLGRDVDSFAYFMDQGTGKTKVILDDAAHNYRMGRINFLLIIAPNSVKSNWVDNEGGIDEVSKHMAPDIPYVAYCHSSIKSSVRNKAKSAFFQALREKSNKLLILVINVEGIQPKSVQLEIMCKQRDTMIVVDESTRISNRTARRTKVATNLRKHCKMARIATGTPIIKSPLKAFSQLNFLDPNILNQPSYTAFAARYTVGKKVGPIDVIFKYVNTDEIAEAIAGCSYRVLKEDCLDLPPKVYDKRLFDLEPEIRKHYEDMRSKSIAFLSEGVVSAVSALSQLVRLQQILANHLPIIDPDTDEQIGTQKIMPGFGAKIDDVCRMIEDTDEKVIIWCKFRFEISEMSEALRHHKISHVTFSGEVSEDDRLAARNNFQNDPSVKVFVGQVRTGGVGITLTAASIVIYLSNTFSTEDRVQSEDRAHRIGQIRRVTYYDLVYRQTIDERILKTLRSNRLLSDEIMRDGFQSWI